MNRTKTMTAAALMTLTALCSTGAFAQASQCKVGLTQEPLVMRVGKDEFRMAFGLDASTCKDNGCSGTIRYNTTWEAEDGTRSTEPRSVSFDIPGGAERSLTVDRSYFDLGEARHTTQVVSVDVGEINCKANQTEVAGR